MAITRTQIAKQLLAQGGRTGFQGGGADMGGVADKQGNVGASFGGGSEGQFSPPDDRGTPEQNINQRNVIREARVRDVENFINRPTFGFTDAAKFNIAPLPIRFIQGLGSLFTGPTRPPVTSVGGGGGGNIPYWAQLGYSSEAEYLAALARAQAPSITEPEPEEEDEGLRLAFRADGGPIGGEYDFESARQMYGLGKLVKKVTRTVKKIAKSPIGKAALLYAGAAGLGSFGRTGKIFSSGMFKPTNIMSGLFGVEAGANKLVGATPGIFGKLGLTKGGGSLMPTALGGIAAASVLAGLLTPAQEEEAQELSRGEGIDIEAARRMILQAGTSADQRALAFKADGGRIEYQEGSKEPVAKKTMPLLDMGGKEMDLREDGGFVPIGRMEKADDVPARLSKNEFVFTADAVRNAGDGDVDKGAEVMYNMMKNLEAGGDVSEESQGLEGARKMFQTSQRLEEVI
jgi:hypothetical protein